VVLHINRLVTVKVINMFLECTRSVLQSNILMNRMLLNNVVPTTGRSRDSSIGIATRLWARRSAF
jgi:hypothetical protein